MPSLPAPLRFFRLNSLLAPLLLLAALLCVLMTPSTVLAAGPAGKQAGPSLAPQQMVTLSQLEEALFHDQYVKEAPTERVDRLEAVVFGQSQPGQPLNQRLDRLSGVVMQYRPQAPVAENNDHQPPPGIGTLPTQNPPAGLAQNAPQNPPAAQPGVRAPNEDSYPAVSELEQHLYSRQFPAEDLNSRLTRIETTVFNGPQPGSLSERTDRVRFEVFGTTAGTLQPPENNDSVGYGNNGYAYDLQGAQNNAGAMVTNPADMQNALSNVEQNVLKSTFPSEPTGQRLDRLERAIFHQTSPELSEQDRLQRVIAVAAGGGDNTESGVNPLGPTGKASFMRSLLPIILTILPMVLL
ncbi:MAG: hypothetical protein AB7P76_10190 [Candidatus Melainabacteria bacterium]